MHRHKSRREFYKYLLAKDVSAFGSFVLFFSVSLIVYSISQSGIVLSIFELASVVPSMLLAVPIGAWLNGKDLKRAWIYSSLILASLDFFVFFYLNIYTLFLLNIVGVIFLVITGIAIQTVLVEIVDREELPWANSTTMLTYAGIATVSPAIAGFILNYSWNLPFLVDGLTYILEALIAYTIAVERVEWRGGGRGEKTAKVIKSALKYLRGNTLLRNSLALIAVMMLVGGGLKILNIAYFSQFGNPYVYYGLAMTFSAVGSFIVLIMNTLKIMQVRRPHRAILLSLPIYMAFFFILSLSGILLLDFLAFFLLGIANGVVSPNSSAVIQSYSAKEHLSTIVGFSQTLIEVAKITSISLMGVLVTFLPTNIVYLGMGIGILATFIVFLPAVKFENLT